MGNGDPKWMTAKRNVDPSHTFAANAQEAIDCFKFNEDSGYFGEKASRGSVRHLESSNPVEQAHLFFAIVTKGGSLSDLEGGKGWRADLKDGTVVTLRDKSADGSPSLLLSISRVYEGRVKSQKIHFVKGDKIDDVD